MNHLFLAFVGALGKFITTNFINLFQRKSFTSFRKIWKAADKDNKSLGYTIYSIDNVGIGLLIIISLTAILLLKECV